MNKGEIITDTATKAELRSVVGDFNEKNKLYLGNKVVAIKRRDEVILYISKRKELLCKLFNGDYAIASDISKLNKKCIDFGFNEDWTLEQYKAYVNNRGLITSAQMIYDPVEIEDDGQYVTGVQSFEEFGYNPSYLTKDVYNYLVKINNYLDRKIKKNIKNPDFNLRNEVYKDYILANQYSYPYIMEALHYDLESKEQLSSMYERRLHL